MNSTFTKINTRTLNSARFPWYKKKSAAVETEGTDSSTETENFQKTRRRMSDPETEISLNVFATFEEIVHQIKAVTDRSSYATNS